MSGSSQIPTTLVTGHLGAGKTTAIRHLLDRNRGGARWAVVVNEFGKVGIDGEILSASGGSTVKEVPGGCVCCVAGPVLRATLVRLLREVRPERLIIEPTGLAHPSEIRAALRTPGLREHLAMRATITLVDPRVFRDPRWEDRDGLADQLAAAQVLVANHADRAEPEDFVRFQAYAAARFPPPDVIAVTSEGRLDPAWLDLPESPGAVERRANLGSGVQWRGIDAPAHAPSAAERGVVVPEARVFEHEALVAAVQALIEGDPSLPGGLLRLKGVFRTERGARLLNATADQLRVEAFAGAPGSRFELFAPAEPAPDLDAAVDRLLAALRPEAPAPPGGKE